MAKVELRNLQKRYGDTVHAVRDVNLEIADGEFFGLLGPSGSGKTSVLRMLAGLETVSEGDILFDGASVVARSPQERNIAMVFEQNALYPHMTGRQNIAYPLKVRGTPKDEMKRLVDDVAEMLNIAHLIDRKAAQMSGGQQQRVAIARALVRRPNLLCLDEPIAHLDTLLRARLRGELKRLQRALGMTSVIVTHDPVEAMTMTDRLAVMRDGRLQQVGTPDEIHDRPANAFVAQFFGVHSMNLFPLEGLSGPGGRVARCQGQEAMLPEMAQRFASEDGRLVLGCRPGALGLRRAGETAPEGALRLPGKVYVAEQIGDEMLVTLQVGELSATALLPERQSFAIDEPVTLTVDAAALYAFDPGSEATLHFGTGGEPGVPLHAAGL
jgi:ABC-type sugar transport system ATPase subunit